MPSHPSFPARRASLFSAALLIVAACGSDGTTTAPEQLTVAHVDVLGVPDSIGSGDVVVFGVRALDAGGREVQGGHVTLASSDPAIALIDPSGRVRAVAPGTATITATVEGIRGTAHVRVTDRPAGLGLLAADGSMLPVLEDANYVDTNGVVEFRELFLVLGTLTLTGGSQPRYETNLRYVQYARIDDGNGTQHLEFRKDLDVRDHGSVRYDEHGDLVMLSESTTPVSHDATAEAGGLRMHYRVPQVAQPITLIFRRVNGGE